MYAAPASKLPCWLSARQPTACTASVFAAAPAAAPQARHPSPRGSRVSNDAQSPLPCCTCERRRMLVDQCCWQDDITVMAAVQRCMAAEERLPTSSARHQRRTSMQLHVVIMSSSASRYRAHSLQQLQQHVVLQLRVGQHIVQLRQPLQPGLLAAVCLFHHRYKR